MQKAQLIIDLGNTNAKLALFKEGKVDDLRTIEQPSVNDIEDFIAGNVLQSAILSSVVHHDEELEDFLDGETRYVRFSHTTPLPIGLDYQTPETLGLDRLANAVGLHARYPGKAALAVDIGTCIKFDLVEGNTYRGGSIAPGLRMRAQGLHTFTDKLPLIEDAGTPHLIGTSTHAALSSGIYNGMFHEMNGMISAYVEKYPNLHVVLTGGDADRFPATHFSQKNHIFADALHTLKGLQAILDYNERH